MPRTTPRSPFLTRTVPILDRRERRGDVEPKQANRRLMRFFAAEGEAATGNQVAAGLPQRFRSVATRIVEPIQANRQSGRMFANEGEAVADIGSAVRFFTRPLNFGGPIQPAC